MKKHPWSIPATISLVVSIALGTAACGAWSATPPVGSPTAGSVRGEAGRPLASEMSDLSSANVRLAELEPEELSNAKDIRSSNKPLGSGTTLVIGGQEVEMPGRDVEIRVIVQLRGEPSSAYARRTLSTLMGRLSVTQANVLRAYEAGLAAERRLVLRALAIRHIEAKVIHEFDYLFNGLALSIPRRDLQYLADLPQVTAVSLDVILRVALDSSVPMIGATQVWQMRDGNGDVVTGKGVTVAIIDTGIDYTHPDLGGCIGPGCKVIGGYDFINIDNDPADDHGHGTHVAGIVAADGVVKGVAPDASLLAYKVCDAIARCPSSGVIAALERAADPDRDPSTNDGADVINLSLGWRGDPHSPSSQAVDNAVDQGIVVVIAAGNRGSSPQTVDAPGVARKALTVAASNKANQLASFSARGPVAGFWDLIKPDITAPGVVISSTAPISLTQSSGDPYRVRTGTSMAAPHVAGAAALIKQLRPNWTPSMVKANLMNSAEDLGLGVFEQGAGRIDALAAANAPAMIEPPSVGFGRVDLSQPAWTVTAQITLTNLLGVSAPFTLTVEGALPPGISTSLSISQTILAAGESREILFGVEVGDVAALASGDSSSPFEGKIVVQTLTRTLMVPFAFFNSPELKITFVDDTPLPNRVLPILSIFIHDRGNTTITQLLPELLPNSLQWAELLPAGRYDVIVDYLPEKDLSDRYTVVREQVVVTDTTSLTVRKSDAIHEVELRTLDVSSGEIVDWNGVVTTIAHNSQVNPQNFNWYGFGATRKWRHFVSGLSADYTYEVRVSARGDSTTGDYYDFFFQHTDGISGSLTLENDPAQFRRVEYQYQADPSVQQVERRMYASQGYGARQTLDIRTLSRPFTERAYHMPATSAVWLYNVLEVYSSVNSARLYTTPYLRFSDSDVVDLYFAGSADDVRVLSTTSVRLSFGVAPPHWFGRLVEAVSDTEINLLPARGAFTWVFLNQMQDLTPHVNLPYELYREGTLVDTGSLSTVGHPVSPPALFTIPLPAPGAYTLTVPYEQYLIANRRGTARVTLRFDTTSVKKTPPYLISLNVLAKDRFVDTISPAETAAMISFELEDDSGTVNAVSLEYRLSDGAWQDLTLDRPDPSGNLYSATLPILPDGSYVALRINADDGQGNWLNYELDPALYVPPAMRLPVVSRSSVGGW